MKINKKKILLIIAMFIVCHSIRAQCNLTIAELEKLVVSSSEDFETKALEKGFSLYENSEKDDVKVSFFLCDKKQPNGFRDILYRSVTIDNDFPLIMFTTTSKNWYLQLKKTLASKGYKFIEQKSRTILGVYETNYYYSNKYYKLHYSNYVSDGITKYSITCNKNYD